MRPHFRSTFALCAAAAMTFAGAALASPPRAFTVADDVGYSTFLPPENENLQATPRVVRSPDGKRYLVVTLKGDLSQDRRVASFWVFDAAAMAGPGGAGAAPEPVGRWASASNIAPVSHFRWSSDGEAIVFLGADDDGARRVYRLPVSGGEITPLTPKGQDVTAYDERAGQLVFLSHDAVPAEALLQTGGQGLADVVEARGESLLSLLFPTALDQLLDTWTDTLWQAGPDGQPHPLADPDGAPIHLKGSRLVLSADGRKLLVTPFAKVVPASWERYRPPGYATPAFKADKPGEPVVEGVFRPRRYAVLDLDTGRVRPVLDAPFDIDATFVDIGAAWGPGGRLALVGAYPRLAPATNGDDGGVLPCALAVVEASGEGFSCLQTAHARPPGGPGWGDRPQIVAMAFSADGRALTVRRATANAPHEVETSVYVERGGRWARTPDRARAGGLQVEIEEAMDRPPVLSVRTGEGDLRTVFDPNPQLAGVALGAVEPYAWTAPDGRRWEGALVKPAGFEPGRRYPLVVQSHGLDRSRFLIDGPSATGFAAQALAGRGFLVLQVSEPSQGAGTPQESEIASAGYRAGVRSLVEQGLADPKRVGISAWSHYGPHVMSALLDDPSGFAAAVFAEASYNSYPIYLNNIDYMGQARERMFRDVIGAKPFGAGLKLWLDRAEGFRTEGLCTPSLIEINSPVALAYGWSSYAALRAQDKPVDLLYIRNGAHMLVRPSERLAAQGMLVDWYDYWLNGHKDPDPAKAARYARWDAMAAPPRCGAPAPAKAP
ncbi:prolyl oligopeptidase family serine peptidase [Phenylobacterium sp.]|uniref:S9 family peptidase n=1 Tax=Phenylobacterium sp. TaxID=1871053 RepID=UPI0035B01377